MRYKSNLKAPDLSPYFRLVDPPIQLCGHDIPSDPDFDPNCGFWSIDEAAILFNVANQVKGAWVDIGARFGWTAAHLATAGCTVTALDPGFRNPAFRERFIGNTHHWYKWFDAIRGDGIQACIATEDEDEQKLWDGFVIDGNHDAPNPANDAWVAANILSKNACVILLHDYVGRPVREAGDWLVSQGFKKRVYFTPNGVGLFWRGLPDFVPPDHIPDPLCEESMRARIEQDGGTV